MNLFQIEALSITIVTFVLSFALAFYMTKKYKKTRAEPLLLERWNAGLRDRGVSSKWYSRSAL